MAGRYFAPETVRFMQFHSRRCSDNWSALTDFFGTEDIAVANVIDDPVASTTNYRVYLDFDVGTTTTATFPAYDVQPLRWP